MESPDELINSASCQDLKFRIDMVPSAKSVMKAFPVLGMYPEFNEKLPPKIDQDLVLRYIMILYQEKTPLLTVDDYNKRKVIAALWAGFPQEGGRFREEYKNIITGKDKTINRMVIRFCRMQRNMDFTKLAIYENALHTDMERMGDEDVDHLGRQKMIANIEVLTKAINELTANFLAGDQTKFIIEDLLDEIELGTLDIKPEDVAKKIRQGKDPAEWGKYYGKDYRFQLYAKT